MFSMSHPQLSSIFFCSSVRTLIPILLFSFLLNLLLLLVRLALCPILIHAFIADSAIHISFIFFTSFLLGLANIASFVFYSAAILASFVSACLIHSYLYFVMIFTFSTRGRF